MHTYTHTHTHPCTYTCTYTHTHLRNAKQSGSLSLFDLLEQHRQLPHLSLARQLAIAKTAAQQVAHRLSVAILDSATAVLDIGTRTALALLPCSSLQSTASTRSDNGIAIAITPPATVANSFVVSPAVRAIHGRSRGLERMRRAKGREGCAQICIGIVESALRQLSEWVPQRQSVSERSGGREHGRGGSHWWRAVVGCVDAQANARSSW